MLAQLDPSLADLLDRIPLDARVILDVGCGTGALGAAYKRLNPRARLLGIESDAASAAIAASHLDEVANADPETDPLPFTLEQPIDCIIYGDVLARLRDPWAVIRRHAEALSDNGVILVRIPNVEHWSVAEHLLRGTCDYAPGGLFDPDTIRLFSLESARRGLEQIGLVLCDVHPCPTIDAGPAEAFVAKITPALHALGIDPVAYLSRAAPRHFIWRARRTVRERMTIAASMLNPVGGVSHVRVVYPLQAMRTDPSVSAYIGLSGEITVPSRDEPHIFVLHRPGLVGEHGASAIRALLGEGWLIITEFDDHPDHFGMLHGDDQYSFTGVHAVQTSTPALAEVLRTRNPEVAIFPNMIRTLPDVRNFLTPERLTLFFGALNREQDWAPLMPSINAIIEKVGDRLGFCVVHDRGFFDALQTPHKQFTPTCDHETYLNLLGQCEISLMPLSDNAFNRAKSDLKFIEAGACRVAALASDIVYAASIEDGRTGLIFRNPEEFHDRLLRLIVMPDLARALGSAARSYVAGERMLAYQVAPRLAWYRALWSKRVELTNALYSRMALPRGITLSATPNFFDAGVPS